MPEQRRVTRDEDINPPITCLAELPNGTVLDGMMSDFSANGARISGVTSGLSVGDHIRLVLVIQSDQKVVYEGDVKYVDSQEGFFGLAFTSGPQPLEADNMRRLEDCCGHRQDTQFCAHCGKALSSRQGATT